MASNRDALILASIFTVMMIIPTASQSIDYGDASETSSPVISHETSTNVDVEIDPNQASTVSIERHDTAYKVQEIPEKRVEQLETPEAILELKKTNKTALKILKSPYGTLKKGIRDGRRYSSFEGANKSKLTESMKELTSKAENFRTIARKKMLPDVEIRITRSKAPDQDERVMIENDETSSIEITGWTLQNSDGDRYIFDEFEIPARGTLMAYTKSKESLDINETDDKVYIYNTDTDWDHGSEEALLFNAHGEKIDEDSY